MSGGGVMIAAVWGGGDLRAQTYTYNGGHRVLGADGGGECGVYQLAASATAFTTINLTANITPWGQMILDANMVINGGGYTLNMNNMDRAFFIAAGQCGDHNLTNRQWLCEGRGGWR